MEEIYSQIFRLLDKKMEKEAEELANKSGIDEKDWERILTDHFWDWHTEH